MATNLAPAAPTEIQHVGPHYKSAYGLSQQASPTSSDSGTPTNSSPISPRNNYGFAPVGRQLRPPRQVLYTPAVLRPTERPGKFGAKRGDSQPSLAALNHPLTPATNDSNNNSSDDSSGSSDGLDRSSIKNFSPQDPTPHMAAHGIHRIITEEWVDERYDDVTGEPTRDHWKPDASVDSCEQKSCQLVFGMLNRRHHCRRCGSLYCGPHSLQLVPLDQHARFHPQGNWVRACNSCHCDYKTWESARSRSRNDSGRGSITSSDSGSGAATPIARTASEQPKKTEMLVGSLSRDWNWSTF